MTRGRYHGAGDGVAIEKAFAIEGEPAAIWDALWSDLSQGEASRFVVEHSSWPHTLAIKVDLGGVEARITYNIIPRGDHSEVSAKLEPLGSRYGFFQLITFGRLHTHFEMLLVQGLSNLKHTVEGKPLLGPVDEG